MHYNTTNLSQFHSESRRNLSLAIFINVPGAHDEPGRLLIYSEKNLRYYQNCVALSCKGPVFSDAAVIMDIVQDYNWKKCLLYYTICGPLWYFFLFRNAYVANKMINVLIKPACGFVWV
jgi:hypothetical protein